jgi:hypothetical protein
MKTAIQSEARIVAAVEGDRIRPVWRVSGVRSLGRVYRVHGIDQLGNPQVRLSRRTMLWSVSEYEICDVKFT